MTREEAIKVLKADRALYETDTVWAGDGTPDGELLEALDMAIEALSQPERPKGRWKRYEIDGLPHFTVYQCSECGRFENEKEPYCHCGADMRGDVQ